MLKSESIAVFSELSQSDLATIDATISWSKVPKGTLLFSNGDHSNEVYFVHSGTLRATTFSLSGREISYQELSGGAMFGELSAIDDGSRTTSILAVTDAIVGKVGPAEFWKIMESHSSVMRAVVSRLAGLVRFLIGRVYEFSAMDVKDRVRAEILRLGTEGIVTDNTAIIEKLPTHEQLANRVATHREAVTKEISNLAKNGYIQKKGKRVEIVDVQRLRSLLEQGE